MFNNYWLLAALSVTLMSFYPMAFAYMYMFMQLTLSSTVSTTVLCTEMFVPVVGHLMAALSLVGNHTLGRILGVTYSHYSNVYHILLLHTIIYM